MNPDMRAKLRQLLIKHEGYRLSPYEDTTQHITIGIGRNLTIRGVLPSEVDYMCNNDIDYFNSKLSTTFEWFNSLNDARQIALIDMCFNMGYRNFCLFEKMISYLSKDQFDLASNEILNSEWPHQVGQRANDIATIIKTGEL